MSRDSARLQLFLAHRAALVDYATPLVGDRMCAEDIVQEAYFRFLPAGGRQDAALEQPLAYLYRIVRNLALDWSRRRALERKLEGAEPLWWMVPGEPRTPEQETFHRNDLEAVESALARLTLDARTAVEMHRFGNFTLAEIAAHLGVSVPTAHRLVKDGLLEIAAALTAPDGS